MSEILLKCKDGAYPIIVAKGAKQDIPTYMNQLGLGKDAVIITHPVIYRLYGKSLSHSFVSKGYSVKVLNVPEGEKSKSADFALKLIEQIAAYDVKRKIFIVALGGGVIGDLAGFVAAIYKRGVPYIQVPTSFLAQIDSSIGGKTAIDLKHGKNLVGAFYQPRAVFTDPSVLSTLTKRQMQNGMAEAIKYGIIKDATLFRYIEDNYKPILANDSRKLLELVERCVKIKVKVVSEDEKETKGIRTILNFGHTVGHAIEAAGDFYYQHGEAVALGMRVAARLSVLKGFLDPRSELRINSLISNIPLPDKVKNIKIPQILKLMQHDKKFVGNKNRFVLATSIGQVKVVGQISDDLILKAIQSIY
jgi:3-dehydroquinate synthase